MTHRLAVIVLTGLCLGAIAGPAPATSFNSSRSNLYRLVYSPDAMSAAQAAAVLADLDRAGRMDAAKAAEVVRQLLAKHGADAARIKKVTVRGWDPKRKSMAIIVLTNPADEPQAIAVTDEGVPAERPRSTK